MPRCVRRCACARPSLPAPVCQPGHAHGARGAVTAAGLSGRACCGSTLPLQSLGREEPVLLCSTHRRSQLDPCHRAGACCRSCLRDSSDETVLPSRDGPSLSTPGSWRDILLLVAERRRCPLSYVSWSVRTVCQLPWSCASRLGRSVPGGRICVLLLRPRSSLAGLPPAKDNFNNHFNTGDTATATRA